VSADFVPSSSLIAIFGPGLAGCRELPGCVPCGIHVAEGTNVRAPTRLRARRQKGTASAPCRHLGIYSATVAEYHKLRISFDIQRLRCDDGIYQHIKCLWPVLNVFLCCRIPIVAMRRQMLLALTLLASARVHALMPGHMPLSVSLIRAQPRPPAPPRTSCTDGVACIGRRPDPSLLRFRALSYTPAAASLGINYSSLLLSSSHSPALCMCFLKDAHVYTHVSTGVQTF
jgi:hypothetical protein